MDQNRIGSGSDKSGFAPIIIVLAVVAAIAIAGGIFYFARRQSGLPSIAVTPPQPIAAPAPSTSGKYLMICSYQGIGRRTGVSALGMLMIFATVSLKAGRGKICPQGKLLGDIVNTSAPNLGHLSIRALPPQSEVARRPQQPQTKTGGDSCPESPPASYSRLLMLDRTVSRICQCVVGAAAPELPSVAM